MSWFWIIAIVVVLYFVLKGGGGSSSSGSRGSPPGGPGSGRSPSVGGASGQPSSGTKGYKPRPPSTKSSGISFGSEAARSTSAGLGEQVTDFLTGASLQTSASTYQCGECFAFYSPESYELLRTENGGRCASCRTANLRTLGLRDGGSAARPRTVPPTGHAAGPGVATLTNYRSFEGQVVTFTGRVVKVRESRRGGDFAVMFEDKRWNSAFKLMMFKSALNYLGGSTYAQQLEGATVTVRGLLVNHPKFGYQMILNDRRMVLRVER